MSSIRTDFEGEAIARLKYIEGEGEMAIVADYVNKKVRIELLGSYCVTFIVLNDIGIRELAKFLTEVEEECERRSRSDITV